MKLKQSVNLVGVGAASGGLWGGVWGSLIGLLFLSPLAGFALGGSVAPVRESFPARWPITEINDDFIRRRYLEAEDLGPVLARPQGPTGEGLIETLALSGPRPANVAVAGAGKSSAGAISAAVVSNKSHCVAGRTHRALVSPRGLTGICAK